MPSTREGTNSLGLHRLKRSLWRSRAKERSPSPEKCDKFLRKHVDSFRVAPPGPVQYDEEEEKFRSRADIAAEDLEKIIAAHDQDSDAESQLSGASWDLVFKQMAAAKECHGSKPGYDSKFNSVADVASAYVSLIPEDYGFGVLKGGLALIFEAASKHEENRGRILDTFETLPSSIETISMAFDRLNPNPESREFFTDVLNMFIRDMPFLIKILLGDEPWYRKVADFLLLKIPESLKIDDILSRWNGHISQLKEHVERMKIDLLSAFPTKLHGIEEKAASAEVMMRSLLADSTEMKQALMESLKRSNTPKSIDTSRLTYLFADIATIFREDIIDRKRDRELLEREQQYRQQDRAEFYRERQRLCAGRRRLEAENQFLTTQVATLSRQVSNASMESRDIQSGVHPIQLLGVLGIAKHDSWNDLRWVLRQHEHFDAADRGKAQWIVNTNEFRDWLREDHSSILLIDGCMNPSLTSPLSGICGGLIGSIAEDEDSAVTFFFAGLHVDRKEETNCGPTAMMKSLIAQLLLSEDLPSPDLGSMNEKTLEDCSRGDIRVLCEVFVEIAKQIPEHMTVFCLIDGVSWYEQPPWSADIHYVATVFEYLARRDTAGRSGLVKVLLTSPSQSMEVVHLARKREDVWWYVSLAAGHIHPHVSGSMRPLLLS